MSESEETRKQKTAKEAIAECHKRLLTNYQTWLTHWQVQLYDVQYTLEPARLQRLREMIT